MGVGMVGKHDESKERWVMQEVTRSMQWHVVYPERIFSRMSQLTGLYLEPTTRPLCSQTTTSAQRPTFKHTS